MSLSQLTTKRTVTYAMLTSMTGTVRTGCTFILMRRRNHRVMNFNKATEEEICTAYMLDIDADPEAARALVLAAVVSNALVFILLYLVT